MAQNITLLGASYSDVPAVTLPKTGGGTASFDDTTDATATADKILSGYTAYANGVKLTGTATGGGGSVTQDQDGFIVLPPDGGGSPSVSGLVYETGTWTPSEDVTNAWISFANTHTVAPFFYMIEDASNTYSDTLSTNYLCTYYNYEQALGAELFASDSSIQYGQALVKYRHTSATSVSNYNQTISFPLSSTEDANALYPRYWAKETGIRADNANSTRYWRAGRTYKWIAVWAPTT